MNETELTVKSHDGVQLYTVKWEPPSGVQPKAIMHLVHGMAEHIGRYHRFAEALTKEGFLVIGHDHRGHGRTANDQSPIYFDDVDGWDKVVRDIKYVQDAHLERSPNLPVFLFGHSMGSFLAKCYIQRYGQSLSGTILSGTGYMSKWTNRLTMWLAERDVKKGGPRGISQTLAPTVQKNYNKAFQPIRTNSDWLSRDRSEVDRFILDPLCGKELTAGFYRDLLIGMGQMDDPKRCTTIPKELPILLIGGEKDPVGSFGKGIHKTKALYQRLGIDNVDVLLYEGARHELLNETNRETVTEDILNWLNGKVKEIQNVE